MHLPSAMTETNAGAYPAISACLGEARPPSRAELRRVARRIRRECYPLHPVDRRLRRGILRAALAALGFVGAT
jgi:hypothetical protein